MKLARLQSQLRKTDVIPKGWKTCSQWANEWSVTLGYATLKIREAFQSGLVERRYLRSPSSLRPVWHYHFKTTKA